jgi:hypothetical protein
LERKAAGATLRVAVLGCSTGAEAYSVAWRIRSARPDLKVIFHAVDISRQAVEFAKGGVYSLTEFQLTNTPVCYFMTASEMEEMFERDGDLVAVRSWIKKEINWHVGDVGEPNIHEILGTQDIVVANNFLCHMDSPEQGHLFVSGVDLDVRTKVACDLGLEPVEELLEEIHEGDSGMRRLWPFHYAGVEPLDKRRRDWRIRYATVFQLGTRATPPPTRHEHELIES